MTLGVLRDREKKPAGDLTVSKHIIIVPACTAATGPDLTVRKKKHRAREQRGRGETKAEERRGPHE